jgi:hypothetical protein
VEDLVVVVVVVVFREAALRLGKGKRGEKRALEAVFFTFVLLGKWPWEPAKYDIRVRALDSC